MLKKVLPYFGFLLFLSALWILYHVLKHYNYHEVAHHLTSLPPRLVMIALGLTLLNYFVLTGYDTLAVRYINHALPYRRIALASFVGYAFSQNLGFPLLTGGSVRYGLYSSWGMSTVEVTQIVAFTSLTFWLGVLTIGGVGLVLEPNTIHQALYLPREIIVPLGVLFLTAALAYLALTIRGGREVKIRNWTFVAPSARVGVLQVLISTFDWGLAGLVLYLLLPASPGLSYLGFLGLFVIAQLVGAASNVPGGLGIFETAILLTLSKRIEPSIVLSSLLAFRVIYYLLPLVLSAVALGSYELFRRKARVQRVARAVVQWIPELAPPVLALLVFLGGVVLLFSGATPAVGSRLRWLGPWVPLPLVEVSHFVGSLSGAGLLLLARGLQRRLDGAHVLTCVLLAVGIVVSLLKGFDYEEAIILGLMLAALLPCRQFFYRKASMIGEPFSRGWILAIIVSLSAAVWMILFSYKYVEYSNELWWQFTLRGDAPRSLRATVGAISVAFLFAIVELLRPSPADPEPPGPTDIDRVRKIVTSSPSSAANLALLGDKRFLFSDSGKSFVMYAVEGRSWIAMGDPVGSPDELAELVWCYRELVDRHDGWTVFYEVGPENLSLYVDLGLTLLKVGEEARVRLENFSLDGQSRKNFRHQINKLEKEGWCFEILSQESVPCILPRLKEISNTWLREKSTREKGFSLGSFHEKYIEMFPVGVVRNGDNIAAFVNIWVGGQEELSVDLMRYGSDAPVGVMDYLFLKLMLWGKENGYRWFNLGMAPLSGLEARTLAPLWARMGAFIASHGEHFYNFQGLRQYKEKFDPEWQPRYLATPGGLTLPGVLTNLASLVSGSLKGVVSR